MRPPADDDGAVLPAPHAYAFASGVLIGLGAMNNQGDLFDRRFYITAISAMTGQQLWCDDYLDVEPQGVLFFDGAVVVFETRVHRSRERSWLELRSYGYEVLTGVPVHTRALSADVDNAAERLMAGQWAPRVVGKRLGKVADQTNECVVVLSYGAS